MSGDLEEAAKALDTLSSLIHQRNIDAGWWKKDEDGNIMERNIGELLMLVVSELAEAMEGDRKSLNDDHLPMYPMFQVEIIDCLIRCFDILGREMTLTGNSMSEIFMRKVNYNANRLDHKIENRESTHGKKY